MAFCEREKNYYLAVSILVRRAVQTSYVDGFSLSRAQRGKGGGEPVVTRAGGSSGAPSWIKQEKCSAMRKNAAA
ncbi:MAG TPA: hypothetical protein DEB31_10095 [Clostridiales bacterium]|nr:hypothetical protein [Clostridiales bacterium]